MKPCETMRKHADADRLEGERGSGALSVWGELVRVGISSGSGIGAWGLEGTERFYPVILLVAGFSRLETRATPCNRWLGA